MVYYHVDQLEPGMILGRSIITRTGELLLAAGKTIENLYIQRLKKLKIPGVYIEVAGTDMVNPKSIISAQIEREIAARMIRNEQNLRSILKLREYSRDKVNAIIHDEKNKINEYLNDQAFLDIVNNIINEVLSYPDVIVNLVSLEKKGSHLFEHALRVTVMSLCVARRYMFTDEDLKHLALGAINADIGLIAIPENIIEKKNKLEGTDLKIFQNHTEYGFNILSQNPAIPATSASVALQHHESQDGSGYPQGLKGENAPPSKSFRKEGMIHRFSEIVAVADNFDIMTEGRSPFGYKLSRKEAMKILFLCADEKLNSDVVLSFSKVIPIYPVGTRVKLLSADSARYVGCFGAVVEDNPDQMDKPKIVVYENRVHKPIEPFMVDLSETDSFQIEALL